MNELLAEAINVVDELNYRYYDFALDDELIPFELKYCTYEYAISYFGIYVWGSVNDGRNYIGDTEDKQPLIDYVSCEVKVYKEKISSFKI